jgi:hypothetical protein
MAEIDSEWFKDRIRDKKKSTRGLARHLDIDPASASRMINGQRKMSMEEAQKIAIFLGLPINEVMRHTGIQMDGDGQPSKIVLAAMINETGELERLPEPRPLPQSVIEKATLALGIGYNQRVLAAQIRAAKGPLNLWDDAVILFTVADTVEPLSVNALSIVRLRDGKQYLAKIDKARKTGEAQITTAAGKMEDAYLETATPIIALIP